MSEDFDTSSFSDSDFDASSFSDTNFDGASTSANDYGLEPVDSAPIVSRLAPQDNRTFTSEAKRSFGEGIDMLKYMGTHDPRDTLGAMGEGIAAGASELVNNPGAVGDAIGEFATDAWNNPAAAAGSLVGDLPLAMATGGAGGFVAKKAAMAGLKTGIAQGSAIVGGSTVGGGAAGAAGAGVRAESQGREVTGKEALTAAVISGAMGGVAGTFMAPKGTVLGKNSYAHAAVEKVGKAISKSNTAEEFAAARAMWIDPMVHFMGKAHAEDGGDLNAPRGAKTVSDTYQGIVDDLTDLSNSHEKTRSKTSADVAPIQRVADELPPEEHAHVLEELRRADATEGGFKESNADLAATGMSPVGIKLFRAVLKAAQDNYARAAKANGSETGAPYGRIPRVWDGKYRVFSNFEGLEGVQGFDSASAARDHATETGGLVLDSNRAAGYSIEEILDSMGRHKFQTADQVFDALDAKLGKRTPNIEGMSMERRGVEGFTTFRSIDDVINAVRMSSHTTHAATNMVPVMRKLSNTVDLLKKNGDNVSAEVLLSTLERVTGKRKTTGLASGARAAAFHAVLGVANHIAPLLNVVSAIIFTPAYVLREARRAGADPTLLQALSVTLKALPSLAPEGIRKRLPKFTKDELVELNAEQGHIPTADSVNFGDRNAGRMGSQFETGTNKLKPALQRKLNKALQVAAEINTWQMRHTEASARRFISVAFRQLADESDLSPVAKERLVTTGVTKVAGDFNKGMRAQVLEGGSFSTDVMSVLLTFQTYIWKKGFEMADMLRHDKQAFFTMISPLVGLAGLTGVPLLMNTLDTMVESMDDDGQLSKEWDTFKLGNKVMFHGMLSELPADSSGRFALSLPFGVGSEYGMNILGVGDMFRKAGSKALHGDISGAVRGVIPNDALRAAGGVSAMFSEPDANGFVTYNPVSRGEYNKSDQVTKVAAAMSAIFGISPSSSVEKDRKNQRNNDRVLRQREKVKSIRDDFILQYTRNNGRVTSKQLTDAFKELRKVKPTAKFKQVKAWMEAGDKHGSRYQVNVPKSDQSMVIQ